MSPAIAFALILLGLLLAGIGIERIARKIARYYRTYPNRRVSLPSPKSDSRSSIETFRRINNPYG